MPKKYIAPKELVDVLLKYGVKQNINGVEHYTLPQLFKIKEEFVHVIEDAFATEAYKDTQKAAMIETFDSLIILKDRDNICNHSLIFPISDLITPKNGRKVQLQMLITDNENQFIDSLVHADISTEIDTSDHDFPDSPSSN
jgi:hypothetical protein